MKNNEEVILQKFIEMLKKEKIINDNKIDPFKKTEQLLYKYNDFKEAIRVKEEQIEELEDSGIKRKSKSIVKYGAGSGEVKTDNEKLEEKIQAIRNTINNTKGYIAVIDRSLDMLSNDKFFPIIRMKYFEKMTHEEIGEQLYIDSSTVCRNKNRLIRKLMILLFPDDSIGFIMG